MPDTETLTPDQVAHIECRWITDGLSEDETDEAIGSLCASLRAAWEANQQIIEVVDDTNKQIQSLKSENNALRAQLAQAQARIEKLDAIVSAYENNDEEALAEAENL